MSGNYYLQQTGQEVQEILNQVEEKTIYLPATQSKNGLMSSTDKVKLDGLDDDEALSIAEIDELCV